MDLTSFKKRTQTTAWFDFDAEKGMRVELLYISPEEMRRRAKSCMNTVQGIEKFDDEKLLAEIATRILNWSGFTLERVAGLIDIDIPENDDQGNPINPQALVTCSDRNKLRLLKESWEFRPFIESKTVSLAEFKAAARELERKNSSSSPGGASRAEQAAETAAT